jgi:hypothetical protein
MRNARPAFDFGFSRTHYAHGIAPGEIGGLFFRGDQRYPQRMAYYGVRLVVPVYLVLAKTDGGPGLSHVEKGTILARERTDFLAYPFTGCYAGSVFSRSVGFMRFLLILEDAVGRIPILGRLARVFVH